MDNGQTTGVMLTYDTATGWDVEPDYRDYGQSAEIVDAVIECELVEVGDYVKDENEDYAYAVDSVKNALLDLMYDPCPWI